MTYSRFLQGSLPLLVELTMVKRAAAAGDKGVAPSPTPTAPPAEVSPGPSSTTPERKKRPGGIPKPRKPLDSPLLQKLLAPGAGAGALRTIPQYIYDPNKGDHQGPGVIAARG